MKRLRLFILSFFAVISIAVNASIIASGKCGTNINWSLSDGGSLELTGTGMMTNYSSTTQAPWFSYREKIVKVLINSGITSIGDYAFHYLKNVTSVSIPNSVTSIGYNAFNFCSGLTSLTIPNSVTSIDKHAFWGVNNIVYTGSASGEPWSAKSLNGYVEGYLIFKDNTKRELLGCSNVIKDAFVIPYSVTSVGKYAFANCDQLTSVTIPNSVTSIGDYVFQNCSNLTSVSISYSLKDIGEEIFLACWKLTTLNVDINNPYYSSYDNVSLLSNKSWLIGL